MFAANYSKAYLTYLTPWGQPRLTLLATLEFHQNLSSNGFNLKNLISDHKSSNLFCIGVPVSTHLRLASRSHIVLVSWVCGFLMIWPSSKTTRNHLILWRGESSCNWKRIWEWKTCVIMKEVIQASFTTAADSRCYVKAGMASFSCTL